MICAVGQCRLEVDHGETGQETVLPHRCEALLNAGHKLVGHVAAPDLALERVAPTWLDRLEDDLHSCELAGAAGLILLRVVALRSAAKPLAGGGLPRAA